MKSKPILRPVRTRSISSCPSVPTPEPTSAFSPKRDISGVARTEAAIAAAKAHFDGHAPRFFRGRPHQRLDAIGETDLLDAQQPAGGQAGDLARRADRRQLVEAHRPGGQPHAAIGSHRRKHRLAQRSRIGLALLRRHQDRPGDRAAEQRPGMGEHGFGLEQRFGALKDAQHITWRGDGLANVDRGDQIVGNLRPRQQHLLLDRNLVGRLDLRRLAVDFLLGRCPLQRIGNHRADIAQCASPVFAERGHGNECAIHRAADIFLLDLRQQKAAASARLGLKPPVDQRLCQDIDHQPLIIGDIIGDLPPGPQDRIARRARQFRLDQHLRLAHRIGRTLRRPVPPDRRNSAQEPACPARAKRRTT